MAEGKFPELPVATLGMRLINLVKLNVLWLVCCLPIVTIGPATSALHSVVLLYLQDRSDEVVKPFFHAFRRDLGQGLLLGLGLLAVTALAVFDGLFLYREFADGTRLVWIPFGILVVALVSVYVYAFPLLCRYRLGLGELVKNCLVLFFQNLSVSLGSLLVMALPGLLAWLFPQAASEIAFLWLLIGGALTAYLRDRSIQNVLAREQRRLDEVVAQDGA